MTSLDALLAEIDARERAAWSESQRIGNSGAASTTGVFAVQYALFDITKLVAALRYALESVDDGDPRSAARGFMEERVAAILRGEVPPS